MKMTKIALIAAIISLNGSFGFAFDTDEPPPKWTLSNTLKFIGTARRLRVNFKDASLPHALEFLKMNPSRDYNPEFELDDALQSWNGTLSFNETDVLMADVLARIAQQIGADIVVSPGVVKFQTRETAQKP